MKNNLYVLVCVFFLCMPGVRMKAEAVSDLETATRARKIFIETRELYQSAESIRPGLRQKFAESKSMFWSLEEGFDKYYWLARVEYFLATYEEEDKRITTYARAEKFAKKALKYNENHSDAFRILGDIYLDSLEYRSALGQINYGRKGRKALEKAVALNNKNYAACKSLGGYCIFAPPLFGGDVDKGIKLLKTALNSSEDSVRFLAACFLGNAYEDRDDIDQAIRYVTKARQICPNRKDTEKWLLRLEGLQTD